MTHRVTALLGALALAVAACAPGTGDDIDLPNDPDAIVLQVRYEGGFAPIEYLLAAGPQYTLLADGRLIHEGPVVASYPGPLVGGYLVTQLDEKAMDAILDLVVDVGLPNIDFEYDDSAADRVMDAGNAVATYWDDQGKHVYSVYALGLGDFSSRRSTKALDDLVALLKHLTVVGASTPYEPARIQVLAGIGLTNPEFDDVRDWPLTDTGLSSWTPVAESWVCRTYGPEVLDLFADATEVTRWRQPDSATGAESLTLLVRPLHPGEPDCPEL
jgi:hypothetical protein